MSTGIAIKNEIYTMYITLVDQADTKLFKSSPTIAAGDFQVSTDGAAFGNLGTLPVVTPAAGVAIKLTLSATEMNGDDVLITCIDAAGAEWADLSIHIKPEARGIEDLAFPTVTGSSLDVTATGAVGIDWGNVENKTTVNDLTATDINLVDTASVNTDTALVLGALATAANTGDIDTATTVMAYVKQLLNEISGSVGIGTMPTGLDPANGINLFEMLRANMGATFATATDSNEQLQILVAALNNISTADVNTQVLDVMNVDTITLPGQVAPPLAPTHRQALGHLYKAYRNRKEQTATTWSLMADNETTQDQKATVSDNGTTAIKQEIVAGV